MIKNNSNTENKNNKAQISKFDEIIVGSCNTHDLIYQTNSIEISNGEIIFGELNIPEYQRPYRWGQEQIKKLLIDWQDFKNDNENSLFYLGSIILHLESNENNNSNKLNIIDGQQRLTTLALLDYVLNNNKKSKLSFSSPQSQAQIAKNLKWIKSQTIKDTHKEFDLKEIKITLVCTHNEDDAYRFFETQNTGGVKLKGSDIIKAHHLRAINQHDSQLVKNYANKWENLKDLEPVIKLLLTSRYWNNINFIKMPLHREKIELRDCIVSQFAKQTLKGKDDLAFGRAVHTNSLDGRVITSVARNSYEARQPLNAGINTVNFFNYFQGLYKKFLLTPNNILDKDFTVFYNKVINEVEGCRYLKPLFDASLLIYLGQFGEQKIYIASLKIFRVVYSKRITNEKAVRENSIPSFIEKTPVFDWISTSYSKVQIKPIQYIKTNQLFR